MFRYQKLGKFTYHIIRDLSNIKPFLLKWIEKEWNIDHNQFLDQKWITEWLNLLPKMKFSLQIVDLDRIKLRKDLMNYKTEIYNFFEELKERAEEMEESILQGSSIEPLIINSKNLELMDGYARYMVLKKNKQEKTYAYVGSVEI